MLFYDRAEDSVPVGPTEVRWSAERGDGVLLGANVLDDDVVHFVLLDLRRQVNVDLNAVLGVLLFDGVQQGVEPLRRAEVTNDPREVHLGQARRLRGVEVVHAVPDVLEDRGERRHTDTSTDEQNGLIVEEVLGRGAEGTVNHDTREHAVNRGVSGGADNLAAGVLLALALPLEVTADSLSKRTREVTDDTDVDRDVVLLGRAACMSARARSERTARLTS